MHGTILSIYLFNGLTPVPTCLGFLIGGHQIAFLSPNSKAYAMTRFDVITVTHGLELSMMVMQARSMRLFLSDDLVGNIIVVNNDQSQRALDEAIRTRIVPEYGDLAQRVSVIGRDDLLPGFASVHGWQSQQVLKFYAARKSEADYTLILDSKNHFVRPIIDCSYQVDDGRLVSWPVSQRGHLESLFRNSFDYFSQDADQFIDFALPNITPFPVRTSTLCAMLHSIEERENRTFAEFFLASGRRFAEFYLLAAYVAARDGSFECEYAFRERNLVTVFPDKANSGAFESMMWQLARETTLSFGIHWAARPLLTEELKNRIAQAWIERGLIDNLNEAREFFEERDAEVAGSESEVAPVREVKN